MKKWKIWAVATLLVLVTCLCSCGIIFGSVAEQGDVTVVIENNDGTYDVFKTYLENVENKDEGAKGVIENLRDREENPLTLEMTDGGYGAYVTAIGSVKQDMAEEKYVIVYTSVASDSYEGAPTLEYEGRTLYQSGVGLSGMTVEAGTVILFRAERSPF